MPRAKFRLFAGVFCLIAVAMPATLPSRAATIPAWLDQAITDWNKANPARPVEFAEIKDAFVWYRLAKGGSTGQAQARESVYAIAEQSGYKKTSQEELVTTARPPAASGPDVSKKCWTRSFTLTVTVGQERMLTSLMCEDGDNWMLGFRVIQ